MTGMLKKPLSFRQLWSWKAIRNARPMIRWVRRVLRTRTLLTGDKLSLRRRLNESPQTNLVPRAVFPGLIWRWKPGKSALGTRLPANKDIFCGKAWRFRLSVSMLCFLLCFCLFWIFPLFAASFSFFLNLPLSFLFHFGLFHSCCFM